MYFSHLVKHGIGIRYGSILRNSGGQCLPSLSPSRSVLRSSGTAGTSSRASQPSPLTSAYVGSWFFSSFSPNIWVSVFSWGGGSDRQIPGNHSVCHRQLRSSIGGAKLQNTSRVLNGRNGRGLVPPAAARSQFQDLYLRMIQGVQSARAGSPRLWHPIGRRGLGSGRCHLTLPYLKPG